MAAATAVIFSIHVLTVDFYTEKTFDFRQIENKISMQMKKSCEETIQP